MGTGTAAGPSSKGRGAQRKRRELLILLGVWIGAVAIAAGLWAWEPDFANRLELNTVDTRFDVRGTEEPPSEVAVIGVDDVTFGDLQERWPLPRSYHARMIDRLSEIGVRAIVYDVQFTEPSGTSRQDIAEDNALIAATK